MVDPNDIKFDKSAFRLQKNESEHWKDVSKILYNLIDTTRSCNKEEMIKELLFNGLSHSDIKYLDNF